MLISCAHGPARFDQKLKDAEVARRSHDIAATKTEFAEARALAKTDEERAEALYREAHAHLRASDQRQGLALLEQICNTLAHTSRAPRAWLDRGRVLRKSGDLAGAAKAFRTVVLRYPSSGVAVGAAKALVAIRIDQGEAPHKVWAELRRDTKAPELNAALRYFEAVATEGVDRRKAIDLYLELARNYPLPKGTYTDDALLQAALLLRRQGEPERALQALRSLFKHDKSALIVGSYTRAAYLEGYLIGSRILRDDLNRPKEARELLERFLKLHEETRAADDALFELSLLDTGDPGQVRACSSLVRLEKHSPNSKYLRCGKLLCKTWPKAGPTERDSARCAQWIKHGTEIETRLH